MSVGGINGAAQVLLTGGTLTFTNKTNSTITDFTSANNKSTGLIENATTKIVMNGSATQSVEAGTISFKGGLDMKNGTLLLNYNERVSEGVSTQTSHGILTFNGEAGSNAIFGNASEQFGTFMFDKVVANADGTVIVNFTDKANYDSIKLTSGGIEGSGKITLDFATTDFSALIGTSATDGIRVFSWEDGNTCVAEISTIVQSFVLDGVTYSFQSAAASDGLYIAYVSQVPEPSEIVALLSIAILAFVIYRRRK